MSQKYSRSIVILRRTFLWIFGKWVIEKLRPFARKSVLIWVNSLEGRLITHFFLSTMLVPLFCYFLIADQFIKFPCMSFFLLTLSWRRPLSYRTQSIVLVGKSMDWFLYDNGLRHEIVKSKDFLYKIFMNIFYKTELLRRYRLKNLNLQLFDAILEPVMYNMIDTYPLLQQQFTL